MNEKKTASKMIALMSKQSLKSSRMRNFFVMITIVLASALLTAILMLAIGQKQQVKNDLSHRQQVVYFNLTDKQVENLQAEMHLDSEMVQEISSLDGVRKVTKIKSFGVRFDYPKNDEYGNDDMIYPMTEAETKEIAKYLEDVEGWFLCLNRRF